MAPVFGDRAGRRVATRERLEERLDRLPRVLAEAPFGWPQSPRSPAAVRFVPRPPEPPRTRRAPAPRVRAPGRPPAPSGARPPRRASPHRRRGPSAARRSSFRRSRTGRIGPRAGGRARRSPDAARARRSTSPASAAPRRLLLAEQLERFVETDARRPPRRSTASGSRRRASRTGRSGRSWRRSPRRTPGSRPTQPRQREQLDGAIHGERGRVVVLRQGGPARLLRRCHARASRRAGRTGRSGRSSGRSACRWPGRLRACPDPSPAPRPARSRAPG